MRDPSREVLKEKETKWEAFREWICGTWQPLVGYLFLDNIHIYLNIEYNMTFYERFLFVINTIGQLSGRLNRPHLCKVLHPRQQWLGRVTRWVMGKTPIAFLFFWEIPKKTSKLEFSPWKISTWTSVLWRSVKRRQYRLTLIVSTLAISSLHLVSGCEPRPVWPHRWPFSRQVLAQKIWGRPKKSTRWVSYPTFPVPFQFDEISVNLSLLQKSSQAVSG